MNGHRLVLRLSSLKLSSLMKVLTNTTMTVVLAVVATVVPTPVKAESVIENISGVEGRLENATCIGSFYANLSAFEKLGDPGCELKNPDGTEDIEGSRLCLISFYKKNLKSSPRAILSVLAVAGTKEFVATITEGGKTLFSSTRVGYHGDAEHGITLIFDRVGIVGIDKYSMEIGLMREGDVADSAFVPVNRRFLPDRGYVFPYGCTLKWVY